MKKWVFVFFGLLLLSCNEYIDKPKNLIPKDKMAEIVADLAINDQVIYIYSNTNLESGTRYILKSHNVKSEDFVASNRYYIVKDKMKEIIEEAQRLIIEKDPKSENKIKSNTVVIDELPKLEKRK